MNYYTYLVVILEVLISLRSMARIQDDIPSSVIQTSFVPPDFSVLAHHPELEMKTVKVILESQGHDKNVQGR